MPGPSAQKTVRRHLVWNSSVMQFQLEQCSQPCGQSAAEQIATVMRAVRRLDDPDAPRPLEEAPVPHSRGPWRGLYCCHTPASVGPCPQAALACLFEAAECLLAAERPPTPPPPPLRVSLGLARDEWDGHEPFNEDVHACMRTRRVRMRTSTSTATSGRSGGVIESWPVVGQHTRTLT